MYELIAFLKHLFCGLIDVELQIFNVCVCVCVCVVSCVWLFETPWIVSHQSLLSMECSKQKILGWVAISFSMGSCRPRDQTQGLFVSHALVGRFIIIRPPGKPINIYVYIYIYTYIYVHSLMSLEIHTLMKTINTEKEIETSTPSRVPLCPFVCVCVCGCVCVCVCGKDV